MYFNEDIANNETKIGCCDYSFESQCCSKHHNNSLPQLSVWVVTKTMKTWTLHYYSITILVQMFQRCIAYYVKT